MLIQFRFKNFRSFRDEAILDLSATGISEKPFHVAASCGERLLPVAAVYGANASGKTNLCKALSFMARYVRDSLLIGGNGASRGLLDEYDRFRFDSESRKSQSEFEVHFTCGSKVFDYGFAIDGDGVAEEWLNSKARTSGGFRRVLYRDRNEMDLPGLNPESRKLLRLSLNPETLVVSLGARLRMAEVSPVWNWFGNIQFADPGDPLANVAFGKWIPKGFESDRKVQEEVAAYLAFFDGSVAGFKVEPAKDKSGTLRIDVVHRMADGKERLLPLALESAGALGMLTLYPGLKEALGSGGLFVVDGLDASLHPLLARSLIVHFINEETNPNHAQLVFTTQNPWHLSSGLLRRDEIWFIEKDGDCASSIYSLADIVDKEGEKIRKGESWERSYLLGEYGAIPELRPLR